MEGYMSNVGEDLMEIAERTKEILGEDCFVDVRAVYSCGIAQPGIFIMPLKDSRACQRLWGLTTWGITDGI